MARDLALKPLNFMTTREEPEQRRVSPRPGNMFGTWDYHINAADYKSLVTGERILVCIVNRLVVAYFFGRRFKFGIRCFLNKNSIVDELCVFLKVSNCQLQM